MQNTIQIYVEGPKVKVLKDWMRQNISVMAWHFTLYHMMDAFHKSGLSLSKLHDHITLPLELTAEIDAYLQERYQRRFPLSIL